MSERNTNTLNLDELSIIEVVRKINDEDKKVAFAIEKEIENISTAVGYIVEGIESGGRLFYIGSGTSGKLGVIDASECPPTFGVEDDRVQAILSGGKEAFSGALEHTEDDEGLAVKDLQEKRITSKDVIVGITASGNTPYVRRAMEYAKEVGAKTIGLICRSKGKLKNICDITIAIEVGPEVIMGSTRMKAGTAQKMVLNMLSTASMIKTGKTYSNLMVNVKPINIKLQNRVKEIVCLATGVHENKATEILASCSYDPKIAIVALKKGCSIQEAREALEKSKGNVFKALSI
jgi:N-acetylmuramic acid 6-phosphate etherase